MSKADELQRGMGEEVTSLTAQEIGEFFKELETTPVCTFCGHENLAFVGGVQVNEDGEVEVLEGKPAIVGRLIHEPTPNGYQLKIPSFLMSCTKCGYNLSFSVVPVLEWKAAKDAAK